MASEKHFPKILNERKENNEFYITMPFYEAKKNNYKHKNSFLRGYKNHFCWQ